ncbi:MAG TPA: biotin carboxylase N-terminal domain-containing protein [Solirubrobacteraceae bacterium]
MKRVFIANRGEIAVRIVRACRTAGLECVVGVSDADRDGMAARLADRSVCIGPAAASASYLRDDLVLQAALGTGCDAVHPGYGFLAESTALASRCAESDVVFVGPPPSVIALTGDKLAAREQAQNAGLPVLPGRAVGSVQEAIALAGKIGYPVLLKAAGGGGGRGIKLVGEPGELPGRFALARAEALAAFGDDRVYVERFIAAARHIEVQIAGDASGAVVHLGERDCSVQRRYQKIVEEAPAPGLSEGARSAIREAAVTLAEAIGYRNLGTVEFVMDKDTEEFFFLEVNCRIQVEHPVTEEVTGRDLVALQLRIAGGGGLGFSQDEVVVCGHAVECRLCAEDPSQDFRPSPGRLSAFSVPPVPGLRVDTHCEPGAMIPPYYDSLMAKLIGVGEDRTDALDVVCEGLEELEVSGVSTNRRLLLDVLRHPDFRAAAVGTDWLGGALV